jgi:hypothetical protein
LETTRGTDIGAYTWQPKTSLSFQDKTTKINDESSVNVIADAIDSTITREYSE